VIDKEKRREGARRLRLKPDGVYGRSRKMCKDRYVLIGLVTILVFRGEEMASSLGGNDRQRGRSEGLDRVVEDRPINKDGSRKDERFALRKIVTRMFKDKAKKRRKTACEHRVQGRGRL
jgi:hypothetical protein